MRPAGRRAWDDGVAMEGGGGRGRWRRRWAVASVWEAGRGGGAGTEEEARPPRTARAGPMGGGGAQRGLLGQRARREAGRGGGAEADDRRRGWPSWERRAVKARKKKNRRVLRYIGRA